MSYNSISKISNESFFGNFPVNTAGSALLAVPVFVVVIVDRMWRKLPEDHPAVYQEN